MTNYTIQQLDLTDKFAELNLQPPFGLTFIPENFQDSNQISDFIFSEPITQINKIFKLNQVPVDILGGNLKYLKSRKNADIFLPAIYIGASLLSENSTVISIAFNVLSNYITDYLKGSFGQSKVAFEIYTETRGTKKIQKITYKGDAEGIKGLSDVIKQVNK